MTDNIDLLKRRDELKLALREENTKTLVDVILAWVNRPVRKMIGNNQSLLAISGTVIVFILTVLIGMIVILLAGETNILQQIIKRFGLWFLILSYTSATASMTIANAFSHRLIAIFRDDLLEIVESVETLNDIQKWVDLICNKKLFILAGIFGVVTGAVFPFSFNTTIGLSVGIGFTVMFILFALQSATFVGFLFLVLFLAVGMRNYQITLFPASPSDSKVISTLSGFMSSFVYLFSIYGAVLTLALGITGLLPSFSYTLPLFWCVIVLIFAISQYSLAQIIQREKWKTLKETQTQIEKIQKEQAVPDKEARETLNWLLDYHHKVKATRNSALNLEAGLNLFNSLLLPVLAFVLGNLDKVIAFFR